MNLNNETNDNEIRHERPVKKRVRPFVNYLPFILYGAIGNLEQNQFDVTKMKDSHLKDEFECREKEGKNYFKYTRGIPDDVFINEMIWRGLDEK